MKKLVWVVAAAAALGMAACSDDDDTPAAPSPLAQVPASASATSQGLIDYIKALIAETEAGRAENAEPVDLSTFAPQAPEDSAPVDPLFS